MEFLPSSCTTNLIQQHKVAVILWLYHIDLWPEFYNLLKPLSEDIVLYIGLSTDFNDYGSILDDIKLFDHNIYYHDNYGCDVAPFLNQLQMVSEPTFIKLHSKKSSWGVKYNILWRSVLVNDLIGSRYIFDQNKYEISKPNIGMISNEILLLKNREGKNRKIIQKISKLIDIPYKDVRNSLFPAGNMFWSKTDIYRKYFTKDICEKLINSLKKETGKIDDQSRGTYSHSLERIFGYIISSEKNKFSFPKYDFIKILNNNVEKGYYSLIKLYDNSCYLREDLNAYGNIIQTTDTTMIIKWLHMPSIIYQEYKILDNNTIIKNQNATNIIR